ncbi:MAG: flagellar motor protein MotB [Lachnospiraceae bacterium]|nr:flagellar motor protein MotB [Lachnospiraceae bacterium]
MARKRQEDTPPPGSPAWMSTFGDMMNLLLCFFVLLFSMSTVDAQKFEMIAASFAQSFSILPAGGASVGDGVMISNGVSQLSELDQYISSMGKAAESDSDSENKLDEIAEEQLKKSEELAEKIKESIDEQKLEKEVDINFTSQYVLLTMNGALLFDSGESDIREDAVPVLDKVGLILQRYAESVIEIEGHTDNVPISNSRFANNDELSSFRALAVFDYFLKNTTLNPAMIKHSGRGEYVPIADNSTVEGRAKNRRVEIKIYHTLSTE